MVPPLVLDIDGTLTRADTDRSPAPLDDAIWNPIRDWKAPVILATGKAFPIPIALCQFLGIDRRVIAETGGIVCIGEQLDILGDGDAARAVAAEMREHGHPPTRDELDLMNRWRETEVAFRREVPLEVLQDVADQWNLEVVDTGFAYHVVDPGVSKGIALERVGEICGEDLSAFAAIGDSVNDIPVFDRVGCAIAVANADERTRAAADFVTDAGFAQGTLEALQLLAER